MSKGVTVTALKKEGTSEKKIGKEGGKVLLIKERKKVSEGGGSFLTEHH